MTKFIYDNENDVYVREEDCSNYIIWDLKPILIKSIISISDKKANYGPRRILEIRVYYDAIGGMFNEEESFEFKDKTLYEQRKKYLFDKLNIQENKI